MATPKPRVRVPSSASKDEVFEIKTTISHPMESGQRKDKKGNPIPRDIINKFRCLYNDKEIFSADLHAAISANPYLAFYAKASESGTIKFEWVDDAGETYTLEKNIKVS